MDSSYQPTRDLLGMKLTTGSSSVNMKQNIVFLLVFISGTYCQDDSTTAPNSVQEDLSDIINTGSGNLQGKIVTKNGKSHLEFLGIPFAEPPIGNLRFKPPVPVKPWSGILEALEDGFVCPQMPNPFVPNITEDDMSEDCLTLNIFTNDINTDKPKAVMIWIYGGGFYLGAKDKYRMQGLIDEDVILVAMNYRLHALGFMSFGNNLVSGNMGLKDQHLAIQWVRDNIRHFGGDPEKITLFGESAGAISVQAHVLSPFNAGVKFGGIAQSGSILYLSIETPGIEKKFAQNAAEALGCPTTLDQATLDCLQDVDAKYLVTNITDPDELQFDPVTPLKFSYWPNLDNYADEPFLPMDPLMALKNGSFNRVPYITGTVENEGAFVNVAYGVFGAKGRDAVKAVEFPAKTGFLLNYGQEDLFNKVTLNFYNHSSGNTLYELEKPAIDFASDTQFLSYDQKSAEIMSSHMSSVYNYYFTQKTNR